MKPTAIIAEDEGPQRRALSRLLQSGWPELEIVEECADGNAALAALEAHQPAIAFLDIRMPGTNGVEVARRACRTSHVVFTTAYEQHAIDAFELGAIDYLLKPVTPERLETTLQRLRTRMNDEPRDITPVLDAIREKLRMTRSVEIPWITASAGNTTKVIAIHDVLFFRAGDSCTRVVSHAEEAIIRTSLKELLPRLNPDAFWQVHRSAIVQVNAIRTVRRNDLGRMEIALHGTSEVLPVSQPFHWRFRGM